MARPFSKMKAVRPSLVDRLLGSVPASNALVDLTNLLADAPSVQDVRAEAIGELNARYRINTISKFQSELQDLYEEYLLYSLEDRHFSDNELADLKHLKL